MNKLDCLLISPPNSFTHSVPYPYLGLCYLAGGLKTRGMKVEVLDCSALKMKMHEAVNYVVESRPRIIGISAMSMNLPFCYKLVQSLKIDYPAGKIAVGGAHINSDRKIIGAMGVDYGFWGECELSFADFCESVLGGGTLASLPGLILNRDGEISIQAPPIIEDIDQLPIPAYDLLPLERYCAAHTNLRTMSMITSRGCPYNCIFCSRLRRTPFRFLNPGKVISQIETLVEGHGFQHIEFVDEIFTLNRERTMEICRRILERKLKFSWGILARADKLDDEMLMALREAGCCKVSMGVETGSERVRFFVNKKITNEKYTEAVALCRKHKIKTHGFYILGHPSETKREMWQTLRFALQLNTDTVNINKMIPLPDSELYETGVSSGKISDHVWRSFMLGNTPHPIYYPDGVAPQVLDRIYKFAWFIFILSPARIKSNLSLLLRPKLLYKTLNMVYIIIFGKRYE
jgi:anaerobic magnesium-protoporphyrin IX monomethyl ester cyclase